MVSIMSLPAVLNLSWADLSSLLQIWGLTKVCPFQSDSPPAFPLYCGTAVSRGPTCLLPLLCPGAALAPAAGLGAGVQTKQGQEPGKEGRHRDTRRHICTMSGLQESEGGMWEGRKSAHPQMCACVLRCPKKRGVQEHGRAGWFCPRTLQG